MLALKEANLDWYITMTDSIVDVIMNAQQNEFNDEEIEQHNKVINNNYHCHDFNYNHNNACRLRNF